MDLKYVLTEASHFKDIVAKLDRLGMGFVAIVDAEDILLGIVTDGDIRRALLSGKFDVQDIINKFPEVMPFGASRREIVSRLKSIHLRHMPLVDGAGKLIEVFTLEGDEFVAKENPVVIMAGGLGARLGALTKNVPKPMLHVAEKPMLQHLIEMFSDHGYSKFIVCVNYKKEVIKEYFGTGNRFGVEIEYVEENKRLGTAGALSLIPHVPSCPFFVINADVLASVDYDDLLGAHKSSGSVATMCVRSYSQTIPFGVIKVDGENVICDIEEKPTLSFNINAGIYVLSPEALRVVPSNTYFDMTSLFETLIEDKLKATTYPISDYWLDIGRVEDFGKANSDLRAGVQRLDSE
ncbi:nucleotidyltransferase family protein [Litorivivens sp.]|uniref:nucleotidyltransferase family protein n=1 Tax=Litorivivens sp. TaxID=2020868 RepID=UPI00356B04A7